MESSPAVAWQQSPARRVLAEQLAVIGDLRTRIGALTAKTSRRRTSEHGAPASGVQHVEADRTAEYTRLQQMLAAAIAERDGAIACILANEELPRLVRAYQDVVFQVNAAWNDILAFDETMRRRFPGRPSIFNTAGPHERAVLAPSTDHSPVPALAIDARRLFAAAGEAMARFVEALASDAEARFGRS